MQRKQRLRGGLPSSCLIAWNPLIFGYKDNVSLWVLEIIVVLKSDPVMHFAKGFQGLNYFTGGLSSVQCFLIFRIMAVAFVKPQFWAFEQQIKINCDSIKVIGGGGGHQYVKLTLNFPVTQEQPLMVIPRK